MIRYRFISDDGQFFDLDDSTFKLMDDTASIEVDFVEKSFQSGADFPGVQRDQSKSISFRYDINYPDEQTFRDRINLLRFWFRKARTLQDLINNIETDVVLTDYSIQYDEGGFNLGAVGNVSFRFLNPFWEDINYTVESDSASNSGLILVNNTGYIETPPIFTVTALSAVTKFSFRIRETAEGILIRDLQFSNTGLNTYIIDCKEGVAEINGILRNDQIKSGTGFFNLRVGQNTIDISAKGSIMVEMKYKKRYYI
jgi:phage-related protein